MRNISLDMETSPKNTTHARDMNQSLPQGPLGGMPFPFHNYPTIISALDTFQYYIFPILVAIGIPLNIAYITVFLRCKLRKNTTIHYLVSCGIFDSVYLLMTTIRLASVFSVNVYSVEGICQIVFYLSHLSDFLSNWFVFLALLDSWINMLFRHRRKKICSVFKSRACIISMFIFAMVALLYWTWSTGSIEIGSLRYCGLPLENEIHMAVIKKMDILFTTIFPASLSIILAIIAIMFRLFKNESTSTEFVRIGGRRMRNNWESVNFKQSSMLLICVVVALVYAPLAIPFGVVKLKTYIMTDDYHMSPSMLDSHIRGLSGHIYNINFACKFFIYYVLMGYFRMKIHNICRFRCSPRRPPPRENNDIFEPNNKNSIILPSSN